MASRSRPGNARRRFDSRVAAGTTVTGIVLGLAACTGTPAPNPPRAGRSASATPVAEVTAPAMPALPPDKRLGPEEVIDFTNGTELPDSIEAYPDYPTRDGGTYDPNLVGVDDERNLLVIKGEVRDNTEGASPDTTELKNFFTGTALVEEPFLYGERTVFARFPIEHDEAGNVVQQHKPVLILWSVDEDGKHWFQNVEVDFAEIFNPERTSAEINIHSGKNVDQPSGAKPYTIDDKFHAFRVLWAPDKVEIFCDNTLVGTFTGQQVPKGKHRVILQLDQAGLNKDKINQEVSSENLIEVSKIVGRDWIGPTKTVNPTPTKTRARKSGEAIPVGLDDPNSVFLGMQAGNIVGLKSSSGKLENDQDLVVLAVPPDGHPDPNVPLTPFTVDTIGHKRDLRENFASVDASELATAGNGDRWYKLYRVGPDGRVEGGEWVSKPFTIAQSGSKLRIDLPESDQKSVRLPAEGTATEVPQGLQLID